MSVAAPTLTRVLSGWQLDPTVLAFCAVSAALYGRGILRSRKPWPIARSASFIAGLLVLSEALLSGIDAYSDELLSVHVIQHLLLILLAPTLLLWGAPVRLALSSSSPAARARIGWMLRRPWVRFLTRPAFGFVLFTIVMLTTHLTGLYELRRSEPDGPQLSSTQPTSGPASPSCSRWWRQIRSPARRARSSVSRG